VNHDLPAYRFAVAPMLDWTTQHCRYFHRLLSSHALLYTEMVTSGALLHGDATRHLWFNREEMPLVLQLGGSQASELALCAKLAEDYGYSAVNLNVGCPSDRVQNGRFGACLMAEPQLVADCVAAMRSATSIPVTVKTRIGIDHQDSYAFLTAFIEQVASVGCDTFIIHARKAWLNGLSPKENRELPPLNYETVYQLKRDYPELVIVINGGLTDLHSAQQQLAYVDGVMLGREIWHNPYILAAVDQVFYAADCAAPTRNEVVAAYIEYVERQLALGQRLNNLILPILGLFHGQPGARGWRRHLSEGVRGCASARQLLSEALEFVA
jgi:tRNA-dihydrouridine synthase A